MCCHVFHIKILTVVRSAELGVVITDSKAGNGGRKTEISGKELVEISHAGIF